MVKTYEMPVFRMRLYGKVPERWSETVASYQ